VVLLVQFMVALVVLASALRTEPELLKYIQRLYWPWVVAEVVLVVFFRFLPGVEDGFLRSVGGFFAGQNTIAALFSTSPNNVLDTAKAGGVFINANVAAMFLGVNGLAALAVSSVTRSRWVMWVGVVALAGVLFTGSKSAQLLAFAMPLAALGAYQLFRSAMPARRRYQLIGALAAGVAAILGVLAVSSGLRDAMIEAFVGRTAIWGFGWQSFLDKPILGLGYGGWDDGFPAYAKAHGLYRSFPPHNMLLATWATTGLAGLALTIAFFVLVFRFVVRGLAGRQAVDKRFVAFAGAALAWVFVQGMGENTDVFGDIHLIPVVALLLVHLIRPTDEEATGDDTDAHRRHSETPAVPPVGDVHSQPSDVTVVLPAVVRGEGQSPGHAGDRRR
jgi:O-antigen ligase